LNSRGWTPPSRQELADELRIKESKLKDILEKARLEGKVVRVKADMYCARNRWKTLKKLVRSTLGQKRRCSRQTFKRSPGLSRKYLSYAALEYLDEIKLTIRTEDKRVLRSQ